MKQTKIRVLALDLEGTIISGADGVFPRPGLYDFLQWSGEMFERIVLFTCVSEEHVKDIARQLVEEQAAPEWFRDVECVAWEGTYKDLTFVKDAAPGEILLVDDKRIFISPQQKEQWVPVPRYLPPYSDEDDELDRLRDRLIQRCAPDR
ncbi:MAG: NIF family HAD-type phosphatase [Rhodothermales bacterium]